MKQLSIGSALIAIFGMVVFSFTAIKVAEKVNEGVGAEPLVSTPVKKTDIASDQIPSEGQRISKDDVQRINKQSKVKKAGVILKLSPGGGLNMEYTAETNNIGGFTEPNVLKKDIVKKQGGDIYGEGSSVNACLSGLAISAFEGEAMPVLRKKFAPQASWDSFGFIVPVATSEVKKPEIAKLTDYEEVREHCRTRAASIFMKAKK